MAAKSTFSNRGHASQAAEIEMLERRMDAAGGLLDVGSKDDFLIDAFVSDFGKRNKRLLRSEVERIARNAVAVASTFLRRMPSERAVALSALDAIRKVDEAAKF